MKTTETICLSLLLAMVSIDSSGQDGGRWDEVWDAVDEFVAAEQRPGDDSMDVCLLLEGDGFLTIGVPNRLLDLSAEGITYHGMKVHGAARVFVFSLGNPPGDIGALLQENVSKAPVGADEKYQADGPYALTRLRDYEFFRGHWIPFRYYGTLLREVRDADSTEDRIAVPAYEPLATFYDQKTRTLTLYQYPQRFVFNLSGTYGLLSFGEWRLVGNRLMLYETDRYDGQQGFRSVPDDPDDLFPSLLYVEGEWIQDRTDYLRRPGNRWMSAAGNLEEFCEFYEISTTFIRY